MQINEKEQIIYNPRVYIEVSRWEWLHNTHLIATIEQQYDATVVDSYRSGDIQVLILESNVLS